MSVTTAQRTAKILLIGNPNTGKSSLFNQLTGARARVGNYPGVTVDRLSGWVKFEGSSSAEIIDLPGTYSLTARSHEEQLTIQTLLGLAGESAPDVVLLCVDATNLLRNLYLVLQVQELGLNVVVALTMMDEAKGLLTDVSMLSSILSCPVVPTVPRAGEGVEDLRRALQGAISTPQRAPIWRWTPSEPLKSSLSNVQAALPSHWPSSEALALWSMMSIEEGDELDGIPQSLRDTVSSQSLGGEELDDEVVPARYQWLDERIAPLLTGEGSRAFTERVDRVLLHPVWGFAVFLATMFILFQGLFSWSDPGITLVEFVFGWLGETAQAVLPAGFFTDLLTEGLIAGVGSVVVFLPQILLLFFLVGFMEDSGYMARVAYLMDRIMRAMGLNGRAFVPMLSGFACAVPAIMATRTMERQRDRLLTMMVVPLMTCSARLPVYTLLIAALFPASQFLGIFPTQGLLMLFMYLFSTAMALVVAWVLSKTTFPAPPEPMVMELPPYRMPRVRDVSQMMWRRARAFLKEAGTVITVCTVGLWLLLSFPNDVSFSRDFDAEIAAASQSGQTELVEALEQEQSGEKLAQSYAGRMGRTLEPVIAPLGFEWKTGVGIIGAFAAREVFVSTMGVVYSLGADVDEESETLRERIRKEVGTDGTRVWTPLTGLSLMIFFALACQCVSTLAVVKRETRGYKWPLFLFTYMTALAWVSSFIVYQGGRLLGFE